MFKVNFSFGFILRNTETGALQYHYPSANNNLVLEQPFLISNQQDLEHTIDEISNIDYLEWVRQQRANSKWVVDMITNVTWFVWKLRDHPIGRGKYLPGYTTEKGGIDALENDRNTGRPYEDNLCSFRCLALHNGCHTKNLERDTKHYYEKYRGVKLGELDELEKLYEVNIKVYSLAPTQSHGEDDEVNEERADIAATPVRRSHRKYPSTLYLNLYENHFSYIKDLTRYSKSFCCSSCGKYWKRASDLWQHEQTCDGKVQLKYPGGAYHVPKTVFEELEDEGIVVSEEHRYFPYRATFDFECYFDKEKAQELKNTEKLNWQSGHVPLSVSVCSNVPGYQAPKCFVSEGEPSQMIEEFVKYLTEISTESSSLYTAVFEALKTARAPNRGESKETGWHKLWSMLTQRLESEVGSRGIDLMASDDEEDEEEIESENEEDRAFLDDEVTEKDPSFYRRFNVERILKGDKREDRGVKKWQNIRICYSEEFKSVTTKFLTS